jgi:hypothetical protein
MCAWLRTMRFVVIFKRMLLWIFGWVTWLLRNRIGYSKRSYKDEYYLTAGWFWVGLATVIVIFNSHMPGFCPDWHRITSCVHIADSRVTGTFFFSCCNWSSSKNMPASLLTTDVSYFSKNIFLVKYLFCFTFLGNLPKLLQIIELLLYSHGRIHVYNFFVVPRDQFF